MRVTRFPSRFCVAHPIHVSFDVCVFFCASLLPPPVALVHTEGLVGAAISFLEPLMSVLMTAGNTGKWRNTPEAEKRLLLGRRLAQVLMLLHAHITGEQCVPP